MSQEARQLLASERLVQVGRQEFETDWWFQHFKIYMLAGKKSVC